MLHVGGRDRCRHKYEVNAGAGRDTGHHLGCQNRICSETFYEFVTDPACARLQVSIVADDRNTITQGWCGILIFNKYTYLASF